MPVSQRDYYKFLDFDRECRSEPEIPVPQGIPAPGAPASQPLQPRIMLFSLTAPPDMLLKSYGTLLI